MAYKYKAVRLEGKKFIVVDVEGSGDMWANVICKGEDNEEGQAYSSLVVSSLNNAPHFAKKYHDLYKKMKENE